MDWRAIEKLNSLRNKAAHQLDSPKIGEIISELAATLKLKAGQKAALVNTKEYQIETLAFALIIVYGDLCELQESLPS